MRNLVRGSILVALTAAALATASASALAAGPVTDRHSSSRGASASTNWSGYAAYGTTFTNVKGDWIVPAADCSAVRGQQFEIAAAWVGLDGYLSRTVEQTGTDTDCLGTQPLYQGWYEFYPDRPVMLSSALYPVAAGDHMHAEAAVSATTVTLTLQNVTAGWTLTPAPSLTSPSLALSSAEWVMEAPTNKLTDFGSVSFSNASASGGSITNGAISAFTNDSITMVTKNGRTVRTTPRDLMGGGTAFTVDFNHT